MRLLPKLIANAGKHEESIAEPATRAITKLTAPIAEFDPSLASRLSGKIDAAQAADQSINVSDVRRTLEDLIDRCPNELGERP